MSKSSSHQVTIHKDLPVYRFPRPSDFEAWLAANSENPQAIWLQFAKKVSSHTTITYIEARDVALCFGWIDSVINAYDADFYLTKFTQRRKKSIWSQVNVGVVGRLISEGKMRPRGLQEVEAAKADGRWEQAYAPQSSAAIPDDLQTAIDASPKAKAFFETLTGASRYALFFRMNHLKDPVKREEKISQFVVMLERGEAPHLIAPKK